jgi:hypothetical protein
MQHRVKSAGLKQDGLIHFLTHVEKYAASVAIFNSLGSRGGASSADLSCGQTLSTNCSDQDDLLVVEGKAAVLVERIPTDSNMWRCSSATIDHPAPAWGGSWLRGMRLRRIWKGRGLEGLDQTPDALWNRAG